METDRAARARGGPRDDSAILPADLRIYDVREIIRRVVDGSEIYGFKALHVETLVCAPAHLVGDPVGILANGTLFSESALKAPTSESSLRRPPDPTVVPPKNIAGFMVGRDYEAAGIVKDGAKLVTAVACARVPKFTLLIDGSFAAGNYEVCGRGYSPPPVHVTQRTHQRDGSGAGCRGDDRGRARSRLARPRATIRARRQDVVLNREPLGRQCHRFSYPRRVLARAQAASSHSPLAPVGYGVFRM